MKKKILPPIPENVIIEIFQKIQTYIWAMSVRLQAEFWKNMKFREFASHITITWVYFLKPFLEQSRANEVFYNFINYFALSALISL